MLFGAVESGAELCVRGTGIGLENRPRYEGGADNWVVKCKCGAQDDDGERMVECDLCEVWQHTRCCGIEDTKTVPPLFLCSGCCASLVPPKTDSSCGLECSPTLVYLFFAAALFLIVKVLSTVVSLNGLVCSLFPFCAFCERGQYLINFGIFLFSFSIPFTPCFFI